MAAQLHDSAIEKLRKSKRTGKLSLRGRRALRGLAEFLYGRRALRGLADSRVRRAPTALALLLFASAATRCENKTFDLLPVPNETAGDAGTNPGPTSGTGGSAAAGAGNGGTSPGTAGTAHGGGGRESGGTGGGNGGGSAGTGGRGEGSGGGGFPTGGNPSAGAPPCSSAPDPSICTLSNCERCSPSPNSGCAFCDGDWCACSNDSHCTADKACDPETHRCLRRCNLGESELGCAVCRPIQNQQNQALPYGVCAECSLNPAFYVPCGGRAICNYGMCVQCRTKCECDRGNRCQDGLCRCMRDLDCQNKSDPPGENWRCNDNEFCVKY
jgi:hypothetical protein